MARVVDRDVERAALGVDPADPDHVERLLGAELQLVRRYTII